jgi:hypothetical protein
LEDNQIRLLLELRKQLEEQIDEVQQRVTELESMLQKLDSVIGSGSFTTADRIAEESTKTTPSEPSTATPSGPRTIVVRSKDRDLDLATIEVSESNLKILPADHASYDIKRGAFARFFIERILGNFQEEDRHNVESGSMSWDEIFDFEVHADESILEELIIRNYGGEERLSEISSKIIA